MAYHNSQAFSTKDRDNDWAKNSCAVSCKGAWWYKNCVHVNLNGLYIKGEQETECLGVNWSGFKGSKESLEWVEIKIRPNDF